MKNIDGLPIDEQIKKLKKDNNIRLIIMCVFLPIIIGLSIYLIILKEPLELGIGFLLGIPLSLYLGYILPVKENNKKIKEIESKDKNYLQLKDTALIEEKKEKYSLIAGFICNLAIGMSGIYAIEILTDGIEMIEFAIVSGIIFVVIPFIVGIILYIISKTLK